MHPKEFNAWRMRYAGSTGSGTKMGECGLRCRALNRRALESRLGELLVCRVGRGTNSGVMTGEDQLQDIKFDRVWDLRDSDELQCTKQTR